MKSPGSIAASTLRAAGQRASRAARGLGCAAVLAALAACNGTAVVTLTSTAAQDSFLAYRVKLLSVELQPSSGGKSTLKVLPASTTVDLARIGNLSEVLGAVPVAKGSYTSAIVTVDYGAAEIVYDDGSVDGLALTPLSPSGQAMGQATLNIALDPADAFSVASKKISRLSLDFKLAASSTVNVAAKTVTVTPLIAASALPTDTKQVRIRGPLIGVASSGLAFTAGILPFDDDVAGTGQLLVTPTGTTTYEINGLPSTGTAGMSALAGLANGTPTVAYGLLTSADTVTTAADGTATTSTDVSFSAAQVLAGGSVQGAGFDRISGIVSARSGNTLTLEGATLVGVDGSDSLITGTATVSIGANTAVTVFGQTAAEINNPQQISVGSTIDAFGTATDASAGNTTLDASAGRVRISATTASALVSAQGTDSLTLGLATLGGRSVAAFDFVGSGASPTQYLAATGALDLTNAAAQTPVIVTGTPSSFGAAGTNFTASSLLDVTTIPAQLVVDWGNGGSAPGTAAPFVTYDSSAIDLDIRNSSIGSRHQIQVGPQSINVVGLSSDPLIVPDATGATSLFAISHTATSRVENFDSYAAFITRLQAQLNGTILATGMTVIGVYSASSFTFNATSITVSLND